jgi:excisionase family DNA binding protein
MSVKDLAAESGVSSFTWRTWIQERRVESVKLGRRVLVPRYAYEQLIRAGRVEAQAPIQLDAPARRRR